MTAILSPQLQRHIQDCTGMGAVVHPYGVSFRVWAPAAESVSVIGDFNGWNAGIHRMRPEGDGQWYCNVQGARPGQQYKFLIESNGRQFGRIDPYARQVTSSVGNAVIADPHFDWSNDHFMLPSLNKLVIYELHIGTFGRTNHGPATFDDAISQLDHLQSLGINCVEVMPIAEFAGDYSWGYNPAHIFAVESAYGGPRAFKRFVKACHQRGIGVILDVVYNHFGPSDLDLWCFDGWSENGKGGIYFYNDHRSQTPWGDTRPDYGRPQVRRFIRDNAIMWLEEYNVDGLRYDATLYMRTTDGPGSAPLEDGWKLFQGINAEIRQRFPNKLIIAEDLQDEAALTRNVSHGGAGFHTQWCSHFVHPVRDAVKASHDDARSMRAVASGITNCLNGDAFQRVIYSESHDEVANGKQRVPSEIQPHDPGDWYARKRSTLAAALVFTSPGIPMIFQGQEFLEQGWFADTTPLRWELKNHFPGVERLYRDLIALRRNLDGQTAGLCGQGCVMSRVDEARKIIAFQRFLEHGSGDDVMVIANFSSQTYHNIRIGFPNAGRWQLRLNTDWQRYGSDYAALPQCDVTAHWIGWDAMPASGEITLPPYSVLVLSQ